MNIPRSAPLLCLAILASLQPLPTLAAAGPSDTIRQDSSKEQITVSDGLELSLFATDDQIFSPSSIDVDDRGRVWVMETVNYRKKDRTEGDRILILEPGEDGRAKAPKVFFQGHEVDGANGICVLGAEVYVSVSDRILVFTDADGDGKADGYRTLFQGKVADGVYNQHDHAIHGMMFGPDGRLYFNFGNSNTELRRGDGTLAHDIFGLPVDQSGKPYRQGMVIRCETDGSEVEVLGHNFRNNWEVAVDSFGTLWQSDNDNGSSSCRINYVMEHGNFGYTDEMTGMGYQTPRTNLEKTMQQQMWHQNDPGVVPNLLITGAGAPAGMTVYEGNLLPTHFQGQLVLAEAGRKVVWSLPVLGHGAGYEASITPLAQGGSKEDFRPSDVSVAPDGSLFMADWFDPVDCCHRTLNDKGRIFRLAPPGHAYRPVANDYGTPRGAVEALKSPNNSVRYLAWTALKGFGAEGTGALSGLLSDTNPRLRARALWLLAATGKPQDAISKALKDIDENVRALSLRIAAQHHSDVEQIVKVLRDDASPLVLRECALALHRHPTQAAAELWASLAMKHDGKDRWNLEALGIGAQGNESASFKAWLALAGDKWNTAGGRDIVWRSRAPEAAGYVVRVLLDKQTSEPDRLRFMRALDFHTGEAKRETLLALLSKVQGDDWTFFEALSRLDPKALEGNSEMQQRVNDAIPGSIGKPVFVSLVERFNRRDLAPQLLQMAIQTPGQEPGIAAMKQLLAFGEMERIRAALGHPDTMRPVVGSLGAADTTGASEVLIALLSDASQPSELRRLSCEALGKGRFGSQKLAKLIQGGALAAELRTASLAALLLSPHPQTRSFAEKTRQQDVPAGGQWSVSELLAIKADSAGGKAVFQKAACIACHVIDREGIDFGPDLSAIGTKLKPEELIAAIVEPSQTIALGFEGVVVELREGGELSGYISSESEDTLSLRLMGGLQKDIPVSTIKARQRLKTSLMPVGLNQALTRQEFADLIAWLSGHRADSVTPTSSSKR